MIVKYESVHFMTKTIENVEEIEFVNGDTVIISFYENISDIELDTESIVVIKD